MKIWRYSYKTNKQKTNALKAPCLVAGFVRINLGVIRTPSQYQVVNNRFVFTWGVYLNVKRAS